MFCVFRDLKCNLLSVAKLSKDSKSVVFNSKGCDILDGDSRVVARGERKGNLYYLMNSSVEAAAIAENSGHEELWHRRYGHLGLQYMKKLASEDMVLGLDCDMKGTIGVCEPCVQGKHHRKSFPTDGGKRGDRVLALVHTDVCGKINTKSLSGCEYFMTFIDDKTRFTWVYMLKRKSQAFDKFLEWKAMAEKSTGEKLKTLRSDNGGEYLSSDFQKYLLQEGIVHQRTVPKTPEQNGVAERINRTIVETARCMLTEAKLPYKFWAEAVSTAVFLRNRSPTVSVKGMTPQESLTGEKPGVKMLRVFGCLAFAHVPKDEREKLDPKARRCVMLGYSTTSKGYRLYDVQNNKVILSRDVIFDESKLGFSKGNDIQKECNELMQREREYP